MKIIYLNGIANIPSKSGEEKIAKANGTAPKVDGNGYSREFFIDMGIEPPKDLEEDDVEFDEEGNLLLDPTDVEEVNVDIAIPLHLFGGCEDLINGTTVVYTTYGSAFTVEESSDEITSYVEYLDSSWLTKKLAEIQVWWIRLRYKFSAKKKNTEE